MVNNLLGGLAMSTGVFEPYIGPGGDLRVGIDDHTGASMSLRRGAKDMFHIGPKGPMGDMGMLGYGMGVWGMGMTGLGLAAGFSENGLQGAMSYAAYDVATNAALMKYHFNASKAQQAGNVFARGGGKVIAPGLFTSIGTKITWGGAFQNSAVYLARSAVSGIGGGAGGMIGGAVGQVVGGDVGNFVGGIGGTFAGAYLAGASAATVGTALGVGALGLGMAAIGAATVGSTAAVGYGTYSTLKAGYRHQQMRKSIHTSGSLAAFHTQGAQTMRARAVQAIHKSHLNARSALGQEANLMHMPSRNYHSRYRR